MGSAITSQFLAPLYRLMEVISNIQLRTRVLIQWRIKMVYDQKTKVEIYPRVRYSALRTVHFVNMLIHHVNVEFIKFYATKSVSA